jgi:hypothetical protein
MQSRISVWNPSNWTVGAIAFLSIAILILVGAIGLGWSPFTNAGTATHPVGTVTSVELAQAFVTDPCAAVERYHGRWWRITGRVLPETQWGTSPQAVFPLEGGEHTGGGLSCQGKVLFDIENAKEIVWLKWDMDVRIDAGDAVDVVCRIHLHGWGFFDYSPEIRGYDCQAPE